MKVDYSVIIESYERINQDLFESCCDIALEADQPVNTTNTASVNSTLNQVQGKTHQTENITDNSTQLQPGSKQKTTIIQRIKNLIDKIISTIQSIGVKILNRLKLLIESDKGFYTTLNQRKNSVQPLQNFKAITYNYNESYIETTMRGLKDLAVQTFTALANPTLSVSNPKVKQLIECDSSSVVSNFLGFFASDKSREGGHDIKSFTREMIDTYRGEKKEQMWNHTQIARLEKLSHRSNDLTNECNTIINQCKKTTQELKRLESKARASNNSQELTNITEHVVKATQLYNAFLAICRMYFELKLESALSARMLLKKFYQF